MSRYDFGKLLVSCGFMKSHLQIMNYLALNLRMISVPTKHLLSRMRSVYSSAASKYMSTTTSVSAIAMNWPSISSPYILGAHKAKYNDAEGLEVIFTDNLVDRK